jgi:hypothetical protein
MMAGNNSLSNCQTDLTTFKGRPAMHSKKGLKNLFLTLQHLKKYFPLFQEGIHKKFPSGANMSVITPTTQ